MPESKGFFQEKKNKNPELKNSCPEIRTKHKKEKKSYFLNENGLSLKFNADIFQLFTRKRRKNQKNFRNKRYKGKTYGDLMVKQERAK